MISSQQARIVYNPNGSTTVFAVPFYFLDNSHIEVVLTSAAGVETTQILNTDFTLVGAGIESGGTLTMASAPDTGTILSIVRNVPITQLVDYIPNSNFPAQTHEMALDRLSMICQYLADVITRSLKYPTSDTNAANFVLPTAALRHSKLLGYDANGNMVLMTLDPNQLTLIAPVSVGTSQLLDDSVTAAKLHSTLDLSAKTITLPAGSVTAAMLETIMDLTSKTIHLPSQSVEWNNVKIGNLISDLFTRYITLSGLFIGTHPPIVVTSAGTAVVNTTYTYYDVYGGKPRYRSADNNIEIKWLTSSMIGPVWQIYKIDSTTELYISGADVTTPDQVLAWTLSGGSGPVPTFALNSEKIEVQGNVKATSFIGDASSLTMVPLEPYAAIEILPDTKGGGQRTSDRAIYAINTLGQVLSCGLNTSSKLAIGNSSPSQVAFMRKTHFSVGADAIDGNVDNRNDGTDKVVKLVCRDNNTFALTAGGILYACGINSSGQCGQGNTTTCAVFKAIRFGASSSTNVKIASFSISDGYGDNTVSCIAIDINGQVWVWGENGHGQLGINNTTNQTRPVKLSTSTATNAATFVSKVATQVLATMGTKGSCYILFNDGTAYSSGHNQYGQLGQGNTTQLQNFALVGAFTTIQEMWACGYHSSGSGNAYGNFFVRLSDNTIYGCGYNSNGELGVGDTTIRNSLTVVSGLGAVSQFYVFGDSDKWCYAVKLDGTVKVWGDNGFGQLGDGSTTDRTSPVSPTGLDAIATTNTGVRKFVGIGGATDGNTFVLFNNGLVYGTGLNTNGALGVGTTTASTAFIRTGHSSIDNIGIYPASQNQYANLIVVRSNKTLFSSGYNASQQLSVGDNSTADIWVATKIQI